MKAKTIADLKEAKLCAPTVGLYNAHLKACAALDVPPEPFESFALDILNAPASAREGLLHPLPPPLYEPFQRYRAYTTPITTEQFTGTAPGSNRPRGKRKPKKKGARV